MLTIRAREIQIDGNTTVAIFLGGVLYGYTSRKLSEFFKGELARQSGKKSKLIIVLDKCEASTKYGFETSSGLSYIESNGLGALNVACLFALDAGHPLSVVASPGSKITKTLEHSGFSKYYTVHSTLEEALRAK